MNQNNQSDKIDIVLGNGVGGGTFSGGGEAFQMVAAGSNGYIRMDATSWELGGEVDSYKANLLAGKWVTGFESASQTIKDLAPLTDKTDLVDSLLSLQNGPFKKGNPTTLSGAQVIPINSSEGTYYIALTGPPYVLKLSGDGSQGQVTFDEFDTAHVPAIPTGVVNFSNLGG